MSFFEEALINYADLGAKTDPSGNIGVLMSAKLSEKCFKKPNNWGNKPPPYNRGLQDPSFFIDRRRMDRDNDARNSQGEKRPPYDD